LITNQNTVLKLFVQIQNERMPFRCGLFAIFFHVFKCVVHVVCGISLDLFTGLLELGWAVQETEIRKAQPHGAYEGTIVKVLCKDFVVRGIQAREGFAKDERVSGSQGEAEEFWL
jgi:hypothetical protein